MKQSYDMFKNYLEGEIVIDKGDQQGMELMHMMEDFLKNHDYDALYKKLRMGIDAGQTVSVKNIIKKIYASIKYIICWEKERGFMEKRFYKYFLKIYWQVIFRALKNH
jgi:hypothetical protein